MKLGYIPPAKELNLPKNEKKKKNCTSINHPTQNHLSFFELVLLMFYLAGPLGNNDPA